MGLPWRPAWPRSSGTFTANRVGDGAGGWGGALDVGPTASVTIQNSTLEGNRVGDAGVGGAGTGTAGTGGAVAARVFGGALTATWSTFSGNARGAGSIGANGIAGFASVGWSILADANPECLSAFVNTIGINVISPGDTSCPASRREAAPSLGPLAANGGTTPTMLPAAGSAAVDPVPAGATCPAVDQRGLPRPQFGGCDVGTVELRPTPPPGATGTGGAGPGGAAGGAVLSGLRIVPRTIRPLGRARRVGLASYRLDRAATVTFRVRRLLAGRRLGARCVPPRPALRGARRCLRRVAVPGSLVRTGTPGLNTLGVTGRIGGRLLPAGRYELVARAAGGVPVARGFRIVR